jgi:hypothetical protein
VPANSRSRPISPIDRLPPQFQTKCFLRSTPLLLDLRPFEFEPCVIAVERLLRAATTTLVRRIRFVRQYPAAVVGDSDVSDFEAPEESLRRARHREMQ